MVTSWDRENQRARFDDYGGSVRIMSYGAVFAVDFVSGFIDNDVKLPDVVCDSSIGKALTS